MLLHGTPTPLALTKLVGWGSHAIALLKTLILILLQGVKGAQVEEIYDLSKPFRG